MKKYRTKYERFMTNEELMTSQELGDHKRRIAAVMRQQDNRITKEEEDIKRRGTCPHCYTVMTTTYRCTNNCSGWRHEHPEREDHE